MSTYVYHKAKERAYGAGLDLLNAVVKVLLTDNTLYGMTVVGASNANPIVITTLTPHGLTTGNTVAIFGVQGNTNANGRRKVTVLSPTTFSLQGIAGNGVYTSGGYVVDLSNKEFLSDIPAGARIASSPALTGKSLADAVFRADPVTYLGVAGNPSTSLTLYIDSGTPTSSRLLAHIDGASGLPTSVNPGTVNIVWDLSANGIFAL